MKYINQSKKLTGRFILLLASFVFYTGINAQITVTNATFPVVGDTLYYAFDVNANVVFFTPPGGGQTWDFSNLTADATQKQVYKSPAAGTAGASFPGADLLMTTNTNPVESYLNVTNQELQFMGYYGPDPIGIGFNAAIRYNPPFAERRSPMNFFDIKAVSSGVLFPFHPNIVPPALLQQLPVTPDSIRVRIALNRIDVVDAWGDLTIPLGTFPVLREKRTQYREVRLDAKISPLGWLDVTDVAIQSWGFSTLGVDTTTTYNYFNNISKEIIAVVTTDNNGVLAERVQFKVNAAVADAPLPTLESPRASTFPNPASHTVQLRFEHLTPGNYQLKMYNAGGVEVRSASWQIPGREFQATLELESLEAGMYWYCLFDDQDNTLFTNRLVISR